MFFSCILNIFVQVVAFIKFFCKSLFIFAHKKMQDAHSSCIMVTK